MSAMGLSPNDVRQWMNQNAGNTESTSNSRSGQTRSGHADADSMKRQIDAARRQIEQDRKLGPGPSPPVQRSVLLRHMDQSRVDFDMQLTTEGGALMATTFVGHEKHSSTVPLSTLRQSMLPMFLRQYHHVTQCVFSQIVKFSEMQVRKVHTVNLFAPLHLYGPSEHSSRAVIFSAGWRAGPVSTIPI